MSLLPKPSFFDRWSWLCPVVSILLAALVLVWFGFSWWTALLVALLLACPATLLWGAMVPLLDAWRQRRDKPSR